MLIFALLSPSPSEFTAQTPLFSPADNPPPECHTFFRGYSFVSPSVIFSADNVIGQECLESRRVCGHGEGDGDGPHSFIVSVSACCPASPPRSSPSTSWTFPPRVFSERVPSQFAASASGSATDANTPSKLCPNGSRTKHDGRWEGVRKRRRGRVNEGVNVRSSTPHWSDPLIRL